MISMNESRFDSPVRSEEAVRGGGGRKYRSRKAIRNGVDFPRQIIGSGKTFGRSRRWFGCRRAVRVLD